MLFLTELIVKAVKTIIGLLPDYEVKTISFDGSFANLVIMARYFLPMDTIALLFDLSVSITVVRIVLAIILRIKSFIPGWGD